LHLPELTNGMGQAVLETFEVRLGGDDPAANIFLELHPDETTTKSRAEHEAIAWALVHGGEAVVFVTEDKGATYTSLAELGRARVCHPFDLWLELLEEDLLSQQEFHDLCLAVWNKDQGLKRIPDRVRDRFPSST